MSLDPLWAESLQRVTTKHFHDQNVGIPWDLDGEIEGSKISLMFMSPTIKRINEAEYLASFKIRLVCTLATEGLYDLANISSQASLLLLENISTADGACITPLFEEVKIEHFDFVHGYKQSLMEQRYSSRLRG